MYFFSMVLKNLTRRPVRTVLTALGLAVAIGSMLALLAIQNNVEESAMRSFNRRGWDLVVTQAGKTSDLNSDISEELVELTRNIPGVDRNAGLSEAQIDLMPILRESGAVLEVGIMINGVRLDNNMFSDIKLVNGRFLREGDTGKAMLGKKLASDLGIGPGSTLILGAGSRFEVIGVYDSPTVFENREITMLLGDAQKLTGKRITGFSVRAATTAKRGTPEADAEIARLKAAIESLRDPNEPTLRLKADNPENYVSSISQLRLVRALTWMSGVLAVVIGVIGILNTMIMSVYERTQEIGILRAMGWPAVRVIRMIIVESLMLAVVAAVFGIIVASLGLHLLVLAPQVSGYVEPRVSPKVIGMGIGVTLLIGLLGGLFPAIHASQLEPTEAIRHE